MTLRGLVLGNSHVAAPRIAWLRNPGRWPGVTFDFVGAHGDALGAMAIDNGVLRARSPAARANMAEINGREEFPLGDYDFFAVAGCKISIFPMMALYRQVRFMALPSMALTDDIEAVEHRLISEPAARAAVVDLLRASFGLRFCAQLGAAMARPVYALEQPRPSAECLRVPDGRFAGFRRAVHTGDAAHLNALHRTALVEASTGMATALPQPRETTSHSLFTLAGLSTGSLRLTRRRQIAHREDDYLHANPDYGGIVLDQLAAAAMAAAP